MKTIKINFYDFWPDFIKEDNFFINLLRQRYKIEISDQPEYSFYSTFGCEHRKAGGFKIYFTPEPVAPDYNYCDFSLSFEHNEGVRNLRLPLYVLYGDMTSLMLPKPTVEKTLHEKTGFCCMVVSNPNSKKRLDFFEKLCKYKKVDSGGRHMNNIGGPVENKKEFIKKYKFTFAFENTIRDGYTTEKLVEPMWVHSMPIYWGNPSVNMEFNTKSFLYWNDFGSDEALIDRIVELDKDDTEYAKFYNQPYLHNNELNKWMNSNRVLEFLTEIFENTTRKRVFFHTREAKRNFNLFRCKCGAIKAKILRK